VEVSGKALAGPINTESGSMATDPLFVDLSLPAGAGHRLALPRGHNAFAYAHEGSARISGKALLQQHAGILGEGDFVEIEAGPEDLRMIVVAGKPIGEPVAQYGPFVMNTREEIEQALDDYRHGRLTG
jgi:redox-sensitive bicupin YhaK (pirin superfamily)